MQEYKLNIKLNIFSAGLIVAYLATVGAISKPVLAQQPEIKSENSVSTKAADLSAQSDRFVNYRVAQLDLEQFCQEFPYNSRCTTQPGMETVPVPVPPPAPSSDDNTVGTTENPKSGWAIVPEISTLGLGGSIVRKISPQLNARVGINAFGFGFDLEDTDATYEADLNLFNVSTLADLHPFNSSGFRLSGGLIFGNNSIEGTATPTSVNGVESITIGGNTFTADQLGSVDAEVDVTSNVAPYLGIGGGNAVGEGKGLGLWWNLGVMFGGSPDVTVTPNVADNVPDDVREEIEAAAEEEEQEIKDEINFADFYPVASLGLSYQF
jgi:hypothetical protein